MIKVLKKTASVLTIIIVAALVIAVGYTIYCGAENKVAYIGNYAAVRVISQSMEPTIPTDSFIIVERVEAADVKTGDVIIFYSSDPSILGMLNTHRVVDVTEDNGTYSFKTKGDNNPGEDNYSVSGGDITGRYIMNVPWLTQIARFFSKPAAFLLIIIVPAIVLLFLAARDVVKSYRELKHRRMVEEEIKRLESEQQNTAENDKESS